MKSWSTTKSTLTPLQEAKFQVYMAFSKCTLSEMYWDITEALGEKVEVREMTLDQCQQVLAYMRTEEGAA